LDEEAGFTPAAAPHGFYFNDDNCAMLNAEMYEFFGYPILKAVFERSSPGPGDMRGQHSDSDMAQHLPALGRLGLTTVNFGPNLTVSQIREHLPKAVIHGQLAPFTFMRNEEINMVAEFIRDVEMAREKRGLVFSTAGSINNGSRLSSLRLILAAIQEYGRYS
jgi:uroporphyrinogen decarboxylase